MNFLSELFKNKTLRNIILGVFIFCLIAYFPFSTILIPPAFIIAVLVYDTNNSEKDLSRKNNDVSLKYKNLFEDLVKPKTFYDVIGELSITVDIVNAQGLYKSENIKSEEDQLMVSKLEKAKASCDAFFDGKEYMKCWTIYRKLEKRGIPEELIYLRFPDIVSTIKQIRKKRWEDISWSFFIAEVVEKQMKKECTKERFQFQDSYRKNKKEEYLKSLPEEQVNDSKLLIELDLKKEAEEIKEVHKDFIKSFPEDLGSKKPNKIKSIIKWKLEDAIKLGEYVRDKYSKYPVINAFNVTTDEVEMKEIRMAGIFNNKKHYESLFGKDFVENIQDMDRVSDFYKFEMFDKDPIGSAIKNKDIERIIFYSLIQIPKRMIQIAEDVSKDDPVKRAPYFAIMQLQMGIILGVLNGLGINNQKEKVIQSWLINQIADPLDKGKETLKYLNDNKKGVSYDERFAYEIVVPLDKTLFYSFVSDEESHLHNAEIMFEFVDQFFVAIISKYCSDNPESAYEIIKPIAEKINKIYSENSD